MDAAASLRRLHTNAQLKRFHERLCAAAGVRGMPLVSAALMLRATRKSANALGRSPAPAPG